MFYKMKCTPAMMRMTGYLHVIALIVAMYGTYRQIDAVQTGKPFSAALAMSLTFMLLLRIPNQICVALKEPHGWYSVMGTVFGASGFAYLSWVTYQHNKEVQKNQSKK